MVCRVLTFVLVLATFFVFACSESSSDTEEFANWKERNEQALAAVVADSMRQTGWQRFKKYSLDETVEGQVADYIYVKVIESASGDDFTRPAYTDSVRVSYQGRLIPSKTYPEGYVFDGSVYGKFSSRTNSTKKFLVSGLTDGFCTAVQHMRRGDHWRVYIPSALGYGEKGSGSAIPGYSMLIFEIELIDFSPAGKTMPVWSARVVNDED